MAEGPGNISWACSSKRVSAELAGVSLPHPLSHLNLLDPTALSQLDDDVLTQEIKRRKLLAKEAASKKAAVSVLHGVTTEAPVRRGSRQSKRGGAGRGRTSVTNGNIPAGATSSAPGSPGARSSAPGSAGAPSAAPGSSGAPSSVPGSAGAPPAAPGSAGAPVTAPGSAGAPSAAPGSASAPSASPGSAVAPSAAPGSAVAPSSAPGCVGAPSSASGSAGATSAANLGVAISSPQANTPNVTRAFDTGGVCCSAPSEAATRALPAPSSAACVYVPGPMMAAVIEATEEGGVDPFLAYGIEAGSDDIELDDDEADDAVGAQAGDDAELRAAELRAAELCAAEVRAAELRAAEVRASEARAAEAFAAEARAAQLRAAKVRATDRAPPTSHQNETAGHTRRERPQVAGAHHFREARQLEAQLRDLQNTVSVLQGQLQEAKTKVKVVEDERDRLKPQLESMQRQLSAEVAGMIAEVNAVRDPADSQVRKENVRKDVAGNPIIPSSLSSDDAFDVKEPHLVRKYIDEGTTQDEYYLFMGGNSKRIEWALKVIGCRRANMNKPIKLWAWGAGGVIDEE
ncbi:unnamed protein product [Closterium sp. Naga37s-1]|nr:unnamed protein product [Closterium sp. Naga37s-1]